MVEHPTGCEAALQPVGTGLGVAHDVEQLVRRCRRKQLSAFQARECVHDRAWRGAVIGIGDVPVEGGAAYTKRNLVTRCPECVADGVCGAPHHPCDPALQRPFAAVKQILSPLRARDFARMIQHRIERPVLREQLLRELRSNQWYARNVVGRVADERLKIDYLIGPNAPRRQQRDGVKNLVFANVIKLHPLGNKLPAILVAGDQQAVAPHRFHLPGYRRQNVVGLVAFHAQRENTQRIEKPPNHRNLQLQIQRHLLPMHLVLIENVMAKRARSLVECTDQIVGLPHLDQVQQIAHEPLHRAHRLPVRTRHLRYCMKNLIDQRMRIDQIDRFAAQIRKLITRPTFLRLASSLRLRLQLSRLGSRRIVKTGQRWLAAQARH